MNEITGQEFVRRLQHSLDSADNRFIFFLGAGCSISSGIPASGPLTRDWLKRLKMLQTGNDDNLATWVNEIFPDYSEEKAALFYGKTMQKLFITPADRQKEIERLTENKEPAFGYVILSQLLSNEKYGKSCNTVFTTNFDDLVADALYLYNNQRPLVITHDSLISFVKVLRRRPLVIKLHGDAKLAPRSLEIETTKMDEAVKHVLKSFLSETGIIFIGYGGNDQGITNAFNEMENVHGGIYWIGSRKPYSKIAGWLEKNNATWVNHRDFDELMLLVLNEFGLEHPDEKRFNRLLESYFDTFKRLSQQVKLKPESDEKRIIQRATEKAAKKFEDWRFVVFEAVKYQYNNKNRADHIFKKGISKFPENAMLFNYYAVFLSFIMNDYDMADIYFHKALKIDPTNENILASYALLLKTRKEYKKAEKYYKKAMRANPNNANILCSYAGLKRIMEDFNYAEIYYKKGIETETDNAHCLGSYAVFLKDVKNDNETANKYFKMSIEADPFNANNIGNYAGFLLSRGSYNEGNKLLDYSLKYPENNVLLLECLFYKYAHTANGTIKKKSLIKMKELIEAGVRSPRWKLEKNVDRAIADGHPHPDFLKALAKIISDEININELAKYDEWASFN